MDFEAIDSAVGLPGQHGRSRERRAALNVAAVDRLQWVSQSPYRVVILTAFSQRDLVQRASTAGALAYLVKPFTKADLIPAIEIAVSRFAELNALQSEIGDLRERLAMRKLLDRAKGVLQTTRGMTE